MRRQLATVIASLSIATAFQVDAQRSDIPQATPPQDSVVMRCQECGTIESIREVQERIAEPTGTPVSTSGMPSGLPIGLVMYIPLGKKTSASDTYVGSVGSHQWQERTETTRYEFTVRMDSGAYRVLPREGVSDFATGDRVKVTKGQIEHTTQL